MGRDSDRPGLLNVAFARQDPFVLSMNANALRLTLATLLALGGLMTACRLTTSDAAAAPAKAPVSTVCRLGSMC